MQDLLARELLEQVETEVQGALHVGNIGRIATELIEVIRPFLLKAIEAAYEHGFYDGAARAIQDGEDAFAFDEELPASVPGLGSEPTN